MILQDAMGPISVANQFDRAGIGLAQPLLRDVCPGMVMEALVDTGNVLHHREDRTDVVRHQDHGTLLVDLAQQGIEVRLEPFIDIGIGLVQDQQLRTGDNGASQEHPLQLTAGQLPDRPVP